MNPVFSNTYEGCRLIPEFGQWGWYPTETSLVRSMVLTNDSIAWEDGVTWHCRMNITNETKRNIKQFFLECLGIDLDKTDLGY